MPLSTIDTSSISGLGYGFKNRIINGAMVIDQRNAGAAQTITAGTAPYTLDRFGLYCAGANQTSQQVSASAIGFQYGLQITGASSASAATLFQRIEAKNIWDCAGQTITLSFKVYNSGSSANMTIQPYYPNSADNYSGTTQFSGTTISIPNGWSTQSYTFTANANCTNGLGLDFQFGALGAGVTRIITGVQLEKGVTATSFDYRPYGTEFMLCQRYYETAGNSFVGSTVTSTDVILNWQFQVAKRAAPTIGQNSVLGVWEPATATYTQSSANLTQTILNTTGAGIRASNFSGMNAYRGVVSYGTATNALYVSSEL